MFLLTGLVSGVCPGLTGDAAGDATGEATGVAVATGAGLFGTLGLGSQAPNTAVETAKTFANINDLLIVFTPWALPHGWAIENARTQIRPLADIRSRNESERFFHGIAVRC